jgi:hypothetical protein
MMESKQEGSSGDVRPLFDANNILFEDVPPLSVSTAKQLKEYIPSGNAEWELGEEPIRLLVPTGQAFVDTKASYLSFEVEFRDFNGLTLGEIRPCLPANGSWADVFSQTACTHSSGVEIDRTLDSGVWNSIKMNFARSKEYRETVAAPLFNQDTDTVVSIVDEHFYRNTTDAASLDNEKNTHNLYPAEQIFDGSHGLPRSTGLSELRPQVVIPMHELLPCWNPDGGRLMPPQLAAGQVIDLETYDAATFFQFTKLGALLNVPPFKVFIKNLRLNVMTYTMTDSVLREIGRQSMMNGLAYSWKSVHTMTANHREASFSMQVSTALSRVDSICVKSRNWDDVHGAERLYVNSFSSNLQLNELIYTKNADTAPGLKEIQGRCDSMQVQIGSLYLPSQPLNDTLKFYHSTMEAMGMFRLPEDTGASLGVPLSLYTGRFTIATSGPLTRYTSCVGVAALSIASSPTLPESGLSISPQRTAVIELTFTNPAGVQRLYNLFLTHSKSCELRADSIRVFS